MKEVVQVSLTCKIYLVNQFMSVKYINKYTKVKGKVSSLHIKSPSVFRSPFTVYIQNGIVYSVT